MNRKAGKNMVFLKISCILIGIILMALSLNAYIRQKLTDETGFLIGGFSVFLTITGILLHFYGQEVNVLIALAVICFCFLLLIIFSLCTSVSVLVMKNRELAMQVSLLNQENERIIHEIGIIPAREEKRN